MFVKSSAGIVAAILVIFVSSVAAQREFGVRPTGSGGILSAEQAAYDVKHYDLALEVDPPQKSIKGVLTVRALLVNSIDVFVLDLDSPFAVEAVALVNGEAEKSLKFERTERQIRIALSEKRKKGETVEIRVRYGGVPRVAPRPPWIGGFVWSQTKSGEPWFATAVQNDGADLWFPVKDHPSDKADSFSLHFTVPEPLVAASNGRLQSVTDNKNGTRTYNWEVSQPASNYAIALNVAPYKIVKDEVKSITGETIPIELYVLPEHFEKGQSLIDLTKKYNAFFEEYLGPYPFRADKIGIAETPHLGMEHQSITAYGNNFVYNDNGDDWLMFHEFGHEWWANLVTGRDWNDFWIHEGFQSFMDTFWIEKTKGKDAYFKEMKGRYKGLKNAKPVAPREPRTTTEMYLLPPDYVKSDGDIYGKGALILHALRFYIGDDAFFKSLRRMAYPDPKMERVTDGTQTRLATTDEFMRIAEKESGKKLGWFFEVYLRRAALPKLSAEKRGNKLELRWETEGNLPFPMPVEVKIGETTKRVEMKGNKGSIKLPSAETNYEIDPHGWVLKIL